MINFVWRNAKWRLQTPISIVVTLLQPLLWLVLYSAVATQTMQGLGIENYTAFILPGVLVLVALSACSSGGILNFIMKNNGSFYRIVIAPVKRSSIVLGQIMEAVLLSFIEIAILAIISLFFGVRVASGLSGILMIALLLFLTAFFYSGISYTISLHLPNEVIYETIMNAIVLPIFFLSSALFPADSLSGGLAVAATINPFTHIINIVRGLILDGSVDFLYLLFVIVLFTGLCTISYLLARWSLKKQTLH